MKTTLSFLSFFFFGVMMSFSQSNSLAQGSLQIELPDSSNISCFLNGIKVEQLQEQKLFIDSIPQGNHQLELLIKGDTTMVVSTSVLVSPNQMLSLKLNEQGSNYKLMSLGIHNTEETAATLSLDSSPVREISTETIVSTNSKCAFPASQVTVNKAIETIKGKAFQRERLKYLERFFSDECLTVQQLRQLINLIDDEDDKLNMLIQAEDHLFDLNNIQLLRNDFILSRSLERFDQWKMMMN
ncbi:MAG: DUF4476 domain-containing protein [Flavobacteriales bacterium]|nr:DUF4476 domain-containing protein [Flavobacteriales bacterium]